MSGDPTAFGVNFADGRIKGYPISIGGTTQTMDVRLVRGNTSYGQNAYVDNGNGTITDNATGLMWLQADSGSAMSWQDALAYAEASTASGYSDWRLPNAKELQSIVDYTRSPDTTGTAAIDPLFKATNIGTSSAPEYGFYWTGTSHVENGSGDYAVYVAFGRALGWMQQKDGSYKLMDVHGAGAQRSDPKTGNASDYPHGFGPQGDVIRINNMVRLVRDAPSIRLNSEGCIPSSDESRISSEINRVSVNPSWARERLLASASRYWAAASRRPSNSSSTGVPGSNSSQRAMIFSTGNLQGSTFTSIKQIL